MSCCGEPVQVISRWRDPETTLLPDRWVSDTSRLAKAPVGHVTWTGTDTAAPRASRISGGCTSTSQVCGFDRKATAEAAGTSAAMRAPSSTARTAALLLDWIWS